MFQEITKGVWHATYDHTITGGAQFKTRMTLVRLEDGTLWMHSPIPLDAELVAGIDFIGEVRHIVAPNGFHDRYAADAKKHYPAATLWGSPVLKNSKEQPPIDAWLGETQPPWSNEIQSMCIEGVPKVDEFVFLHRASGTLILTDLLFQIRYPVNALTKTILWMAGVHKGKLAQSRLWRSITKDRAAAGKSVEKMLAWDFERVVLAHGDFVEGDGARERTREALWWMLEAA